MSLDQIERDMLLEAVYRRWGYDFRGYAEGSLGRRIRIAMEREGVRTISAFQERVLHDAACMERFVATLSIHVTSMFRDPAFFAALRETVVPVLRTYPFVRVWVAGCASGEEVYSTAIVLEEAGIYDRCRIYATDLSDTIVERAKSGIFSLASMRTYTLNYQAAGGCGDFSSYYTARYESAIFKQSLKRNIVFATHNLVSDTSFNEFNLILCRNVMIYFARPLQERVFALLHKSLARFGVLGLGKKESLHYSGIEDDYEELSEELKLYRRVR